MLIENPPCQLPTLSSSVDKIHNFSFFTKTKLNCEIFLHRLSSLKLLPEKNARQDQDALAGLRCVRL